MSTATVDRELAAVLITLAPLGGRGSSFLDMRSREFHADSMLRGGWSSGERWLIVCAKALWRGTPEKIDLSYIATLDDSFLHAVMNGIAAYRGRDFGTDWAAALAEIAGEPEEPEQPTDEDIAEGKLQARDYDAWAAL